MSVYFNLKGEVLLTIGDPNAEGELAVPEELSEFVETVHVPVTGHSPVLPLGWPLVKRFNLTAYLRSFLRDRFPS